GDEGGDGGAPVGGDADVGGGEDGDVPVGIDGQDRAGGADTDHVVELPAQGDGHVEVGGDRPAGDADLAGVGLPAAVGHLPGGAELGPEHVEERLEVGVVVRGQAAPDPDDHRRFGQGVGVVVPGLG